MRLLFTSCLLSLCCPLCVEALNLNRPTIARRRSRVGGVKWIANCRGYDDQYDDHHISRFRGGAGGGGEHNTNNTNNTNNTRPMHGSAVSRARGERSLAAQAVLFGVYFLVLSSKSAFAMSMRVALPPTLLTRTITLSTLAIVAGKLCLGSAVDAMPASVYLALATGLLSGIYLTVPKASPAAVSLLLVISDFFFSSIWPSLIKVMSVAELPASAVTYIVNGGRLGTALSFYLGGRWMEAGKDWRRLFVFASRACAAASLLAAAHHIRTRTADDDSNGIGDDESIHDDNDKQIDGSSQSLLSTVLSPPYVLHSISRASLMFFSTFLLFLPSYLSHLGVAGSGAPCGCYSLGTIAGVTSCSAAWTKLSARGKSSLCAATCLLGFLSSAAQYFFGRKIASASLASACFFVWGFSFSCSFFIAPTDYVVMASKRFPKSAIARLDNYMDVFAFGIMAKLNGWVSDVGVAGGRWDVVMIAMAAAVGIGGVATATAVRMERG